MTAGDVPKAGRREWVGLAVLALPTFLVAIDIFVLLLALPKLSKSLGASSTEQLWITDIYGFMLAGFTVTMGTLGDRIGRRKLLLIGAAAFAITSIVAAYSTNPGMLIASRAVLGITGATLMPNVLALIITMFKDEKERAMAFGMWGGTFTLGAIFGPMIGGLLLAHFWWGSVFLVGAPLMVALLIVGPTVLPESRNEGAGKLDPLSVVLSLATMLPIVYGIKRLAANGWQALPIVAIVVGVVLGIAFGRRQLKLSDPILDLRLFRNRKISTMLVSQLSYSVTGGGAMLFMMLYFQVVDKMSTMVAGLSMLPGMVAATIGFMVVTPKLAAKFRPAYVMALGMAGVAAVLLLFTQVSATSGTPVLIIGFAVLSFCGSPLVALGTNLIVGSAPPEQAGSAGSLAQMSNEFGGTLGAALLGTLGFAVYRNEIKDKIPAGLSAHAHAQAHDSVEGAAAVAAQSPHSISTALLHPAHQAFTDGLHAATGVGALLLAASAILVATNLKHVPPIGAPEPAADTVETDTVPAAS